MPLDKFLHKRVSEKFLPFGLSRGQARQSDESRNCERIALTRLDYANINKANWSSMEKACLRLCSGHVSPALEDIILIEATEPPISFATVEYKSFRVIGLLISSSTLCSTFTVRGCGDALMTKKKQKQSLFKKNLKKKCYGGSMTDFSPKVQGKR